jgi:hypothetical protein
LTELSKEDPQSFGNCVRMDKEASKELVWLVYVCLVLAEMHVYL